MKKWAVAAASATAISAIAIVAIWAFAVRSSSETRTVKIPESGNAAEYLWASRICTAVTDWDRLWVEKVIEPTAPANARRASIGCSISTMRALIGRLRDDIDAIDPPTERAAQAQDYIRITPKVEARQLAELKPDFSLKEEFGFMRVRSRAAALNYLAQSMRVQTSWLTRYPYYTSPYIGVALKDASHCDEVPRLRQLEEWR